MQNLSNNRLSAQQRQFIDDLAAVLVQWNMPMTTGRVYGYLQLREDPASLDEIAADLEISKSNACTAAKMLETHGNAARVRERGTKRVLYVIGDDPGTPLRKQVALLGKLATLITDRKDAVATGPVAERLTDLATFHKALEQAMAAVVYPGGRDQS